MRYILRADSSQLIGSGHVMRSSAIAEELIARQNEVIFIGDVSQISWLALRIDNLGFSQILQDSKEFVTNPITDVLILDTYTMSVDDDFLRKDKWQKIVTIADDVTPPYDADLTIHPGLSGDRRVEYKSRHLSGPNYIPFRKSIVKRSSPNLIEEPLVILVVGGGADTFNFVDAVCVELKKINAEFRAGIFSNTQKQLNLDSRFTVVPIGSELDSWATIANLVFTTASTTCLEFIAREVPVGIGCAVNNQEEYYESLSLAGVAVPLGKFNGDRWVLNLSRINDLVDSKDLRRKLAQASAGLIDLKGAKRIVDEILKL